VVVTHNSAIGAIADRVVRLRDGQIAGTIHNDQPMDPEGLKW